MKADDEPSTRTEARVAAVVIALFAAALLVYALPPSALGLGGSPRVNDGHERTFFAFHINPFPEFSENFHLYVIRAKRIMDRGWQGSLFWRDPTSPSNHAAPFQVLLGVVTHRTGGRPLPWSILLSLLSGAAWLGVFAAARRWLPPRVPSLSLAFATLVTVLLRQPAAIVELAGGGTSGTTAWPLHLGARLSTPAWSEPADLVIVILCATMLHDRSRSDGRLATVGALLALLAMGDAWSYTTSMGTAALTLGALTLRVVRERRADAASSRGDGRNAAGLALALAGAGALQAALGRGMRGDVLVRAGLGAPWRDAVTGFNLSDRWLGAWLTSTAAVLFAVGGLALLRWRADATNSDADPRPTGGIGLPFVLALLPAASVAGATLALAVVGVEAFQLHHLYFRADFCQLFALTLAVCEAGRARLWLWRTPAARGLWRAVMAAALLALFALYAQGLHRFVASAWFNDFRLTRDEEALRRWLSTLPGHAHGKVLATASPELNHLCAYWTDADLLLPVGFPYHNTAPSSAVVARMADLLRVYQTPPAHWRAFSLNSHPRDVFSWRVSRVSSARDGFTYQLFHRAVMLQGHPPRPDRSPFDDAITRALETRALRPSAHRPDLLVIDPVSRALGIPDFTGYHRAFASGVIEVWAR